MLAREEQIPAWLAGDGADAKPLTVVKVHGLPDRQGCVVPYRTLHRFAVKRCGFGAKTTPSGWPTPEPGVEVQVEPGTAEWLGLTTDALLAQFAIDRLTSGAHSLIVEGHTGKAGASALIPKR